MLGGSIGTGIDRDIDNHLGGQGTGMGHWKEKTDMVVRGCARQITGAEARGDSMALMDDDVTVGPTVGMAVFAACDASATRPRCSRESSR
jgi:hypothetical protein